MRQSQLSIAHNAPGRAGALIRVNMLSQCYLTPRLEVGARIVMGFAQPP